MACHDAAAFGIFANIGNAEAVRRIRRYLAGVEGRTL
jgi:hypothetical protein